jgi:hypothetical protein
MARIEAESNHARPSLGPLAGLSVRAQEDKQDFLFTYMDKLIRPMEAEPRLL